MEQNLQDSCSGIGKSEFQIYLSDVSRTIRGSIEKIPNRLNSHEKENIYISCLLTFIDLLTPEKVEQKRFDNLVRSDIIKTNNYHSMYKIEDGYTPILYHLDDSYRDYILLLVKKARIGIREDLNSLLYSNVPIKDLYMDAVDALGGADDYGES